MAVSTTNASSGPYTANGVTTVFPFTFTAPSAAEVEVISRDEDGVSTTVDSDDYSVTLTPGGGGSVTFDIAPSAGLEIVVVLSPLFTQDIEFENGSAWLAAPVNEANDRAVARDQYLKARTDRAVLAPEGETLDPLPTAADRAGNYLAFDDDGNPIVGASATAMASYVAAFSALGEGSYTYRSKALTIADLDNIPEGALVRVLVDESKQSTLAVYQMVSGVLEYIFSLGGASDQNPAATGILFDTSGADDFTDLLYTPHASLTVVDASVTFSSASAVNALLRVPDSTGVAPLRMAFDTAEFEQTFTLTGYAGAGNSGAFVGGRNSANTGLFYGGQVNAKATDVAKAVPAIVNGATIGASGAEFGSFPKTVRVRYRLLPDKAEIVTNVNGGANDVADMAWVAGGGSATPNFFNDACLVYGTGSFQTTALKVSASYPNARYAFLGDSLTRALYVTYTDGFAYRVRAAHPGESVLIAGAPGATTADWTAALDAFVRMKPRYVFVGLGANDFNNNRAVADVQADLTTIVNELRVSDIVPIVLYAPPVGKANVPIFNAWIATQDWRSIDIYTALLGTGVALHAGYDTGDGIHWNAAGHTAVFNLIEAYIASQGL